MNVDVTAPDALNDPITAAMYQLLVDHERVRNRCRCGWTHHPFLDRYHRVHIAQMLTVGAVEGVGEILEQEANKCHVVIDALQQQLRQCQERLLSS